MIAKSKFDEIIKSNLQDKYGNDVFGYRTFKTYDNYYSNAEFDAFVSRMDEKIRKRYIDGKGGELEEKSGKYGLMPPKMASVASSSRFCYIALNCRGEALGRSGEVEFEHECRIKGISGTAPQLDAYIPAENIYVEAKCHEIFDSHKIEMKAKYWNLIYGIGNDFGFETKCEAETDTFMIPLSEFGIEETKTMFDIKQLLCHLLGIASQKNDGEKATLVYMFFKPKVKEQSIKSDIDEVFCVLEKEIHKIFNSSPVQNFIKANDITLKAIVEYSEIMEHLNKNNIITLY